jgi:hypothetical protein
MMDVKTFIINKIDELQTKCLNSGIKVKYAIELATNFHIIEVSPEDIRRGDQVYMEWEHSVWDEFSEKFPNEDLLISEKDDTLDMSNVVYSYEGYDFINGRRQKMPLFKNCNNLGLSFSGIDYSFAA